MKLERAGKITRHNAYADLLVSIASDIRSKHHLRKMLRQGLASMIRAHDEMSTKKKGFEESIASYHTFIDSSMASLQKGYVLTFQPSAGRMRADSREGGADQAARRSRFS